MASYQKKGNKWRAEVCVGGNRKAKTFPTKALAMQWARQQEIEPYTEKVKISHTMMVRDLFERYSSEVSINKRGCRREQIGLAALCRQSIADIRIQDLKPSHIADWRDGRLAKVKPGSVQREMTIISGVFSVAVREWGVMDSNPVKMIAKPRTPQARDRIFTDDEIERLLVELGYSGGKAETSSQQTGAAFIVAIETGMRQSEILGLRPQDVDHKTRVAVLRMTKNGRSRRVPLSEKASETLKESIPWHITPAVCSTLFRRARRSIGIDDATFHDARHTAITRLASKLSPLELARVVGHTDLKQLMVYYNESAESLAARL
jgi:integrase